MIPFLRNLHRCTGLGLDLEDLAGQGLTAKEFREAAAELLREFTAAGGPTPRALERSSGTAEAVCLPPRTEPTQG